MVSGDYVPDRGQAVWLHFTPQAGHEQAGRRPALVLTPRAYNERASLAMVCPITSRVKNYPFEVRLPEGLKVSGVVLADQVRSVDWASRQAEYLCDVPTGTVRAVVEKLTKLIR